MNNIKKLIQTDCFVLLKRTQCTPEHHRLAIEECIDEIIKFSNSEECLNSVFRTLRYTRFYLQMLLPIDYHNSEIGKKYSRNSIRHQYGIVIA